MINKSGIGKIIQKLRKEKNLTQDELAEKIDISTNYLSKVERGLSVLNTESFLKIAEVLSFTLEDFGINQITKEYNNQQQELINIILSATNSKIQAYAKAIKLVDEIIK